MAKMSDAELRSLIRARRDASDKRVSDKQSAERRKALDYYRGDNDTDYGDSGDGLSTVVSRDVLEAVESILPGLLKPFVSGDEVARFEPQGPEDEEAAKQATEYIHYLFSNHNKPLRVVYDFTKDGLLYRLGVAKVVHETVTDNETEHYEGLDPIAYAALEADKSIEIIEATIGEDELITAKCMVTRESSKFRVYIIAPDEFLHEDRLAALDDATFLGHKKWATLGDLIAMGLPKAKVMDLGSGDDAMSTERDNRFQGEDWRDEQRDQDDLARKVQVAECYIRCDYDRTGALTWRKVIVGGNDDTVLAHEEVEDHPFVTWTPIPMPHKLIGLSLYDMTKDIQQQKTAIIRESLNALYLSNRPMREYVEGQVNVSMLLSPSVGGLVAVRQPGQIREIPSGGANVAQTSLAMVEHLDTVREARTGSTRYNQGMDSNSLNKTATGVSLITNASTQRQELTARHLAEGMMGIFQKMLGLVCRHADKAEVIRLRGKWVQMDPREWKNNYDMSVAVGLGTGNRDQQVGQLMNLLQLDERIIGLQQGLEGPLLTAENVYEKLKRVVEAMGLKGVERYYTDPAAEDQQQATQQPQPDPHDMEMRKQAADAAIEMRKQEGENALKLQIAHIEAESRERVALIQAETTIITAGMQPPANLIPEPEQEQAEGAPQEAQEPQYALKVAEAPQMAMEGAGEPQWPDSLMSEQAPMQPGDMA